MITKGNDTNNNSLDKKAASLVGLFPEYYDKIAYYAYSHIGNREDAQDISGETFLKALKALKSFQDRNIPMKAWLFRIAHNLVVDYLRKKAKRVTVSIDDIEIPAKENPSMVAEQKYDIERMYKAMEHLTTDQREVIRLRFLVDLSSQEVGHIMNKRSGAVREMQRAAIQKLRSLLVTD